MIVYLDALQVSIRDQQVVRKKAVYVAVGVTLDGERDVLGLWIDKTEGARFWTSVMTELRNRGVKDILFVLHRRALGLPGGDRRCLPLGGQPDLHRPPRPPEPPLPLLAGAQGLRRRAAADLHRPGRRRRPSGPRRAYGGLGRQHDPNRCTASLGTSLGANDPVPRVPGRDPTSCLHDKHRRGGLHTQIRKTIKTRGHFPNCDAALRLIWLSIQRAKRHGAPVTAG